MMKLGKRDVKEDARTIKLASYLHLGRIEIKAKTYVDYLRHVERNGGFGMFANDRLGDCVLASRAHGLQIVSAVESGSPIDITDAEVIADYRDVGGYRGTPETDRGAYMLDALKQWKKKGMRAGGKRHKILAFASVDMRSKEEIRIATELFGGIYCGLRLPLYAAELDKWVWYKSYGTKSPEYRPGSWGGHAVWLGRSSAAQDGIVTWGAKKMLNQGFLNEYCDEGYVALQTDWAVDGKAPPGFDLNQLLADVRARGEL